MLRRSFLLTPLALAAQPAPGSAAVVFTRDRVIPSSFARDSVVFGRAYAACAQPELARSVAETGRFAHALAEGDSNVIDLLRAAGIDARFADAPGSESIQVLSGAWGDGDDTAFERSIHVPFAIRAPGLLPPRSADEILTSTVDLAPTLLGLCGVAPPGTMQGRDLSGLLLGKRSDLPDSVYVEGGRWRAVIRGYDKAVLDLNAEVTALYNLADDPDERINLAEDTASQLKRDALAALARVWMRRIGDGLDPSGLRKRA